MGENLGEKSHFTPYSGEYPTLTEKLTPERAARTADLIAERMEYLRERFPLNTITTENGLSDYFKATERSLRLELNERPQNSAEHLVASAYHAQRAAAIDAYLNNVRAIPEHARSYLELDRNTAYAEAQQSIVSVLLAETDRSTMREAVTVYGSVRTAPWHQSVRERLEKIRHGSLSETSQERFHGLARGVAGHAASIRLAVTTFDRPQRAYSPSAELDGLHGIDFGLHSQPPHEARINTVVQVKAKEKLGRSIMITPTDGNPDMLPTVTHERDDTAHLPHSEQIAAERELDIHRLDRGIARLRREFGHLVDPRLTGLFVELRAAPAGKSWEQIAISRDGQFDIFTGLCNDALRAAAERENIRIKPDIDAMRARLQPTTTTRRRPLRRHRTVH